MTSDASEALVPGWWQHERRPLRDRRDERLRIDDLLDVVRQGLSGVLVLGGCHGAGKTTLVEYAVEAASGFRVCAIAGVESEINLPYGAIHQLIVPFLPLIDDLPAPQRQALQVAFGAEAGPPPERFLIGLACLTLLSRAATDQPVLVVVDDAHWVDAESALVLGFVARRLYADRVGLILTIGGAGEPVPPPFRQLPSIEVGGLPAEAAADLLRSVASSPFEQHLVDRVVADTGGNPQALVEAGSGLKAEELADRAYLPTPIPLARQRQDRYLGRVRRLPPDVQEFLLLVAADFSGDRNRLHRAAAAAGIDAEAAESAAEAARLIEASGNYLRFRYPQIRSAVYHGASDSGRRSAHLRMSDTSDPDDGDERIWHRAVAAAGPDEQVAADLEAAARRTRDRGASVAAAALLRRSVALTPGGGDFARRELALAQAELVIGQPGAARQRAADALPGLTSSGARGEAKRVIGDSLFAQGHDVEAARVLAEAADIQPDPEASADALLAALDAAIWAGRAETAKIARIPAPRPGATPRVSDLLLAGFQARFTKGYAASVAPLRAATRAMCADDLEAHAGLTWLGPSVGAAGSLWDDESLIAIGDRWVGEARRLGALTRLAFVLSAQALNDSIVGRLDLAADRWAEMRELMTASQSPGMVGVDSTSEGLLFAQRGELGRAREAALAQIRESTGRGQGLFANLGQIILAIADLRAAHFDAAIDAAMPVIADDAPFTTEVMLPELIEAAFCGGNHKVAASVLATLTDRTTTAGTPWALGIRARCQALLSDDSDAEAAYLEAISQLGRSQAKLDLARAHLLYGQWLRRAKRRRDARHQLRTAEGMFHAMGANGLAEQARGELRATGERARARSPDTEVDLTPQEARIANLASAGSTNIEIAEKLFISPSTVDYHLGKVFRKLGIRSRTQLAHQLGNTGLYSKGEDCDLSSR